MPMSTASHVKVWNSPSQRELISRPCTVSAG
jgi:hypothetical protein